ncbi:hypothetical protein PoB_000108000 [Plakobranchus ocellatus]|uniref:Uncharacterized protein n=1 Tax=Plakobranchus ocellatus TaxID=259542 RepID=A0AAV3XVY4_9GAST|nr:hypothetical protein PoB_000108000 [Plakobranchus ocellatus]
MAPVDRVFATNDGGNEVSAGAGHVKDAPQCKVWPHQLSRNDNDIAVKDDGGDYDNVDDGDDDDDDDDDDDEKY